MYFSALKRLIASVEEKRFYDVSLMFLGVQGYKELSIVDGAGDGGRDVVSSRSDLRIQLSVRKDWENKINQEAAIAFNSGKRHFIYITNRTISPDAEADFRANNFKFPGQVEVTICDLNLVSTTLAQSGVISEAYRMLGISLNISLSPTPKEIALSSVLLFGNEAKELREGVCDANVCATLFDQSIGVAEGDLIAQVVDTLPGVNLGRAIKASISRLRTSGDIIGPPSGMKLGAKKTVQLEAARTDFAKSLADDVTRLKVLTNLSTANARLLLAKARDVLVRGRNIDDNGYLQEEVRSFIASHGLTKKKREIYETLSAANTIRQFQFGETIDRIFSTNTFDIYRSLGGRTELTMVLDTSVALPLLLGAEFAATESRYGLAVSSLEWVCKEHGIKILVPSVYVNEMAAHGRKALDFLEIYPLLPHEAQAILRNSRNAYLSHYAHLAAQEASDITLQQFIEHFGIRSGTTIRRIENRLVSLLESHGIETGFTSWYEQSVRDEIESRKPHDIRVIVDHDASVCTNLIQDNERGYIFATWDNVLIDAVQDLARIFADNPARINDTLSIIQGVEYESDHSQELLFTLLHVDENKAVRLAEKIERIESTEQAFRFRSFIEDARERHGGELNLDEAQLQSFFDFEAERQS